ncbi:nuclease [Synechococcales cyanobacterium C]|uniref:Nuclease n=1 Tax=Petrachloros mirabilis ULC683 TaxID=2781853 RepID=A0A8K2A6N1_9CYAN|nr:nuclease A inhibitor family protein [Petrachloros mirabilis]NCJ05365.1 nuclease [Petrachloros mirabilis ULC683]
MDEWLAELEAAVTGLLWLSESEASLSVVVWEDVCGDDLTLERVLALTHHGTDTPIEQVEFEGCWAPMVRSQPWHGPEEQAQVTRFQAVVKLLQTHLNDLRVYRIGHLQIQLYTLGETAHHQVVGIQTQVIET